MRSVCIVNPFGPFTKDTGGEITEMKLIDPKDYRKYFDCGDVGEHLMKRALEVRGKMK